MASHTFTVTVADSRIAPGEPMTSGLCHDFKDRDQEAVDQGLEDRFFFCGGRYYNGGMVNVYNSTVTFGAGASSQDLIDEIFYVPPPGVTSVKIRVRCSSAINGGNYAMQIFLDGAQVAEWTNFGALSWRTWKTGIAVTPGANHEFKVKAKSYAGAAGNTYIATAVQIVTE